MAPTPSRGGGRKSIGGMVQRGLTPLLDTLFILLFALLALSDTRQVAQTQEVRIELPAVESGEESAAAPGERVSLLVDGTSAVRLAGPSGTSEPIERFDELDSLLAARLGALLPEEVAIDIVGDEDARHGVMVELLQHLRLRGFTRVQLLATRAESNESRIGFSTPENNPEEAAR